MVLEFEIDNEGQVSFGTGIEIISATISDIYLSIVAASPEYVWRFLIPAKGGRVINVNRQKTYSSLILDCCVMFKSKNKLVENWSASYAKIAHRYQSKGIGIPHMANLKTILTLNGFRFNRYQNSKISKIIPMKIITREAYEKHPEMLNSVGDSVIPTAKNVGDPTPSNQQSISPTAQPQFDITSINIKEVFDNLKIKKTDDGKYDLKQIADTIDTAILYQQFIKEFLEEYDTRVSDLRRQLVELGVQDGDPILPYTDEPWYCGHLSEIDKKFENMFEKMTLSVNRVQKLMYSIK